MTLNETKVTRLADNVWLRLLSRASMVLMAPMSGVLLYLGGAWFDGKLKDLGVEQLRVQQQSNVSQIQSLNAQQQDLQREIAVMQASRQANDMANERWRSETNAKLDRIVDSVGNVERAVSGLSATVQAVQRDSERSR